MRFIIVAAGVYAAAGGIAGALIAFVPAPRISKEAAFPPVFWVTTALLAGASGALQRAVHFVRREKQLPFRRSLLAALVLGTLFVGIQSYGLRCMFRNQIPGEVQTGANAFLTMISAVHALHLTLALLFLVWITLNALADRYDHEYSFGVRVCSLFWHALGVVWLAILMVFLIATT